MDNSNEFCVRGLRLMVAYHQGQGSVAQLLLVEHQERRDFGVATQAGHRSRSLSEISANFASGIGGVRHKVKK